MYKFRGAAKTAASLLVSGCLAAFAMLLYRAPVFGEGESYELYLGASSSAPVLATASPLRDKLLHAVKGESVRYAGDCYEQIKEEFGAELLFCETVCGVANYYLYSPRLAGGTELNGCFVNLHVAVGAEQTAAGTPLIFGGF